MQLCRHTYVGIVNNFPSCPQNRGGDITAPHSGYGSGDGYEKEGSRQQPGAGPLFLVLTGELVSGERDVHTRAKSYLLSINHFMSHFTCVWYDQMSTRCKRADPSNNPENGLCSSPPNPEARERMVLSMDVLTEEVCTVAKIIELVGKRRWVTGSTVLSPKGPTSQAATLDGRYQYTNWRRVAQTFRSQGIIKKK